MLIGNSTIIIQNHTPKFNELVSEINGLAKELDLETDVFPSIGYSDPNSLNKLGERVKAEIQDTLQRIDASNRELEEKNRRVASHSKRIDDRRNAIEDLEETETELGQIEITEGTLRDLRASRKSLYAELLETIEQRRKTFEGMMSRYLDKHDRESKNTPSRNINILSGLSFASEIQFSRQSFLADCKKVFDKRSITLRGDETYFDDTIELLDRFASAHNDEAILALVQNIDSLADDPRLAGGTLSSKSMIDCYDILYGNHFTVVPKVAYNNTPIERLSIGQKSTVLLKIYLADGIRPIIIDSHDDYLDNQFIYDELIPAISEAKSSRQIILVSNNANVVVNSDAEQVIVAEHQEGTISYTSGSLENSDVRAKALRILEGGKEAFQRRQGKYRMT